jgi:general secretion pathway protein L
MNNVRVTFSDTGTHWLRIADGVIVARGPQVIPQEDDICVLIVPARDVALHTLALPSLAPAQARAAAQLALADKSLLSQDQLYIACGAQVEGESTRSVVLVSRDKMKAWIEDFDPDVIIPSPLLLPQPDDGYVRAAVGDEITYRGVNSGFAEDAILTPLIISGAPIITLERDAVETALAATAINPPINLRGGEFARRRQWRLDLPWAKRTVWMAAALLLVSLLIPIAQIIRLSSASTTLEETSASLAQAALGEAVAPESAIGALDTRLAGLRGGGAGFLKTAAAAARAIEATANVELTAMTFDPSGTLNLSLRATSADEIATAQARMRAAGLDVISGPVNPSQGQPVVETQVRGR